MMLIFDRSGRRARAQVAPGALGQDDQVVLRNMQHNGRQRGTNQMGRWREIKIKSVYGVASTQLERKMKSSRAQGKIEVSRDEVISDE